jgi:hypothetical protein
MKSKTLTSPRYYPSQVRALVNTALLVFSSLILGFVICFWFFSPVELDFQQKAAFIFSGIALFFSILSFSLQLFYSVEKI